MVRNSDYSIILTSTKKGKFDCYEGISEVSIKSMNYDTFIFLHNAVKEILEKEEKDANKDNQQKD